MPAPMAARFTVVLRISKRRTGDVSSDTTISEKRSIKPPVCRGATLACVAPFARPSWQHHLEQQLSEQHAIAARQLRALGLLAVQARPVRAAEVLDEEALAVVPDGGMGARHGRLRDDDVRAASATDHHPIPVYRHFEALVETLKDPHGRPGGDGSGGLGLPSDLSCHRWPTSSIA